MRRGLDGYMPRRMSMLQIGTWAGPLTNFSQTGYRSLRFRCDAGAKRYSTVVVDPLTDNDHLWTGVRAISRESAERVQGRWYDMPGVIVFSSPTAHDHYTRRADRNYSLESSWAYFINSAPSKDTATHYFNDVRIAGVWYLLVSPNPGVRLERGSEITIHYGWSPRRPPAEVLGL